MISETDRVIFVEDEVTTGKTILNIIRILEQAYPGQVSYAAASILNGMDEEALRIYREKGIDLHYLVKTDHADYAKTAGQYTKKGSYVNCVKDREMVRNADTFKEYKVSGWMDARRLVSAADYQQACMQLWDKTDSLLHEAFKGRVLVLGTEEFMYPALYIGYCIEKRGCRVRFHATTRSPIAVSTEEGYPLSVRYELRSLYAKDRRTFIYDIQKADRVLIITDAHCSENAGKNSLIRAVLKKNETIDLIRWC